MYVFVMEFFNFTFLNQGFNSFVTSSNLFTAYTYLNVLNACHAEPDIPYL